jgi:hypothetical protein|tara:strand:- start:1859 stop:2518 length:660 start_codon:yes stop_codon:yes gene_type:complete
VIHYIYKERNSSSFLASEAILTTTTETSTLIPVLTHNGVRIPARGTIACHPLLGFGEVVTRSGSRLRIAIDVADGDALDRIAAVSAARTSGAEIEIAGLEARLADSEDAFHGAKALVNGMIESLIAGCTEANEVIVNIDTAEAFGWEFDEFAMELPKKSRTKAKAPAPRPFKAPASKVGTIEDASKPDWLVAEMNECFGNTWTTQAESAAVDEAAQPDS